MNVIADGPRPDRSRRPELWDDGPPHDLFTRLRREAPVHWSPLDEYPDEAGFWSLTRAEDLRAREPRLADLLLLRRRDHGPRRLRDPARGPAAADDLDGPAAPRPDQGAVPARLHAEADRRARGADPRDRQPGARPGRRRAASVDLVHEVAGPVVSRVIGSFIGTPEEDDQPPRRGDQHGARVRRRGPAPDRGGGDRDDDPQPGTRRWR